jgi:hypothetical protein
MARFRSKPVEIEATRWFQNGDHPDDASVVINPDGDAFLSEGKVVRYFRRPDVRVCTACRLCGVAMLSHGWIDTLEGGHVVCPGDWIVTGLKGERYPVKPDIFAAKYEPPGSEAEVSGTTDSIVSNCGEMRSREWIMEHEPTCGVCGVGLFGRPIVWVPGCEHHASREQAGFFACMNWGCDQSVEEYTHERGRTAEWQKQR